MPVIHMSQESRQMKQLKKKLTKKQSSSYTMMHFSRNTARVEQIYKERPLGLKGHLIHSLQTSGRVFEFNWQACLVWLANYFNK